MNILGIGGSIHDFSSCLICRNKVFAIEDERITKVRYGIGSGEKCTSSIQYCLNAANKKASDIDLVVMNDDNSFFAEDFFEKCNVIKINHHLAHAYSVFFTSSFNKAAILVVDGAGSQIANHESDTTRETTSFFIGNGNEIKILKKSKGDLDGINSKTGHETLMSNSIGEFYRAIAETLGLGWLTGPGKMMGMSSYGSPIYIDYIMKSIRFLPNGDYLININGNDGIVERLYSLRKSELLKCKDTFKVDANIASSGQFVYEKLFFHALNFLYSVTKEENLCLAGGAILNSIANGKILSNSKFKKVHILFAPGDDGLSIGAALFGKTLLRCSKTTFRTQLSPYLGKFYSDHDIHKALISVKNIDFTKSHDICKDSAKLIANGKIVGWFQGRSEFGPRALGNRSILADPRNKNVRDHINKNVKNREWYRPFAPAVILNRYAEFFRAEQISDVMQIVGNVISPEIIPAVSHIDGSARLQTVNKDDNPLFFRLIEYFCDLTNVPVLLNTSYNIKGKPIVETPIDALNAFVQSNLDALAIGNYIVSKNSV
jgi:carbamoyltransferase